MSAMLDGRSFGGVVLEPGKAGGDPEVLSFRAGRLHSSACEPYGYGDGAYEARADRDGAITFEAETASPQYGRLQWRGQVVRGRLDGTLTMLRDGEPARDKWVVAGECS